MTDTTNEAIANLLAWLRQYEWVPRVSASIATIEALQAERDAAVARAEVAGRCFVCERDGIAEGARQATARWLVRERHLVHALSVAANWFGDYARQHEAKSPPDIVKAQTNSERGQFCLDAIEDRGDHLKETGQ